MRTFTAFAVAVLLSQNALAEGLDSDQAVKNFMNQVTALFLDDRYELGLELAKSRYPLPPKEFDEFARTTEAQIRNSASRYGESLSIELVREEKIADSLLRLHYLQKFENHALAWRFTFYKPRDKWRVNHISTTHDITELFAP